MLLLLSKNATASALGRRIPPQYAQICRKILFCFFLFHVMIKNSCALFFMRIHPLLWRVPAMMLSPRAAALCESITAVIGGSFVQYHGYRSRDQKG